ncbi:conserved Plasmodium protein, unknown function [Plasmodium sp. gorilla clade G2]|uniref:conserved Plasmodium protein, unknown function n=1 Tax=Plasmodium sp. gorilla clade G2 TaxID=880535 RepID=UPI000D2240D1|nr:conserved Plasmodium protein, unknown function [Plasmodium sp. gorilla clade G2]SOV14612.1 conserved Plasmodium protein, unknown function [Plasmodium sp. gorilla clade G2]
MFWNCNFFIKNCFILSFHILIIFGISTFLNLLPIGDVKGDIKTKNKRKKMEKKGKMKRHISEKFSKGLCCLFDILMRNLIYNLYYAFDQIKENNYIKNVGKELTKKQICKKNLDKSKKNIEKCINLSLTVLRIMEGNKNYFIQHILDNYASIKSNRDEKKYKNKFDDSHWMYHMYKYSVPLNEAYKHSHFYDINVDEEKQIFIKNRHIKAYTNQFNVIDTFIDKHKKYSKEDLIKELNNLLHIHYLNDNTINRETIEKENQITNDNLIDDDLVTNDLFSEYFNNCKKSNKLNILIKEVNLNSLKNFHNILYKNINFIRTFNEINDDENSDMKNIEISEIFHM